MKRLILLLAVCGVIQAQPIPIPYVLTSSNASITIVTNQIGKILDLAVGTNSSNWKNVGTTNASLGGNGTANGATFTNFLTLLSAGTSQLARWDSSHNLTNETSVQLSNDVVSAFGYLPAATANWTASGSTNSNLTGDSFQNSVHATNGVSGGSVTFANLPSSPATGTRIWCSDVITPRGTGANVIYDGTIWRLDGWGLPQAANTIPNYVVYNYVGGVTAFTPITSCRTWERPIGGVTGSDGLGSEYNTGSGSGSSISDQNGFSVLSLATGTTSTGNNGLRGYRHQLLAGDTWFEGWVAYLNNAATSAETYYVVLNTFTSTTSTTNLQADSSGFIYDPFNVTHITNSLASGDYGKTNFWIAYACHGGTTNAAATVAINTSAFQSIYAYGNTLSNVFYVAGTPYLTNSTTVPTGFGYFGECQITHTVTAGASRSLYFAYFHQHMRYNTGLTLP